MSRYEDEEAYIIWRTIQIRIIINTTIIKSPKLAAADDEEEAAEVSTGEDGDGYTDEG